MDTSIKQSKGKVVLVKENYNTRDIINEILVVDQISAGDTNKFAKQFTKDKAGLKKLYAFVKQNIRYIEDGFYKQDIKTPAALNEIGTGDCKSMTIFIGSVLQNLRIPYTIRFAGYTSGGDFTHVYPIAHLKGEDIIMDAVNTSFNDEVPFQNKTDYSGNNLVSVSGLGNTPDDNFVANILTAIIIFFAFKFTKRITRT